jgi:site-specific DNA-methyltransferase (adenine-specific)
LRKDYPHPTPKPPDILRTLIEKSSDDGDTILDPFIGSGTLLDAVKGLNRKVIGYEIDDEYFVRLRAKMHLNQPTLEN